MSEAEHIPGFGLPVGHVDLLEQLECLLTAGDRLPVVADLVVHPADVQEAGGLRVLVPRDSRKLQLLLGVLEGLVIPPLLVTHHPERAVNWLARRGAHLARPQLAFEIVHTGHEMKVGLWLPGWVPVAAVTDELGRVWPGATVERHHPPHLGGRDGWRVAGYRLAVGDLRADHPHPHHADLSPPGLRL
jgi:hypothetical protein